VQTPQKKTYDNQYKKARYQEFRAERDRVTLGLFEGKCYLCGNEKDYNAYHFHHLEYHPEDSAYIRNSKAQWTRNLRLQEATNHPERFVLLCPPCHRLVTTLANHVLKKVAIAQQARKVDLDNLMKLVMLEVDNRKSELGEQSD
jgi:hypothetical protein